jgi:hypothetical protein
LPEQFLPISDHEFPMKIAAFSIMPILEGVSAPEIDSPQHKLTAPRHRRGARHRGPARAARVGAGSPDQGDGLRASHCSRPKLIAMVRIGYR